jgi:hypothetical protein
VTGAGLPDSHDVGAERVEHRAHLREVGFPTPRHYGERAVLRRGRATRDRRIDPADSDAPERCRALA